MADLNIKELSNDELRRCLQEHGMKDIGPIQSSTRELYERQLNKRLRKDSRGNSDTPVTKRRKVTAPSPPVVPSKVIKKNKSHQYRSQRQSHRGNMSVPRPVRTPKLAADSYVLIEDDERLPPDIGLLPSIGFKPSLSYPDTTEDVDEGYHNQYDSGRMGMSLSDISQFPTSDGQDSDNMEVTAPSPLHRRPINRDKWSFSSTARMIGQGVKSLVSSFLTPVTSPTVTPPSRTRHHSTLRNEDSVDIGGEIEIEGNGVPKDEVHLSPEPSAPPFPEPSAPPFPSDDHSAETTHYDWELLPEDVQFCIKPDGSKWHLGKGGFGEVFKGIKDGVDEVAVKVIRLQHNHSTSMEQFKHEIDLISKLRHRHILQFYGACIRPQCLYMVTELMQSDLFTALRTNKQYKWTGEYGKEVCVGIATGIHYLHSRRPPIVHRDIKSPNVLLMDGLAKIADVGIAKAKMSSDMTAQRGFTVAWAAPEVIYRRRATEKIDIWSFGVILWEVVTGKPPGVGRLTMPSTAPAQLRTIYNDCSKEDPQQRPATDEILVTLKSIP